jgi:hypothetical protein
MFNISSPPAYLPPSLWTTPFKSMADQGLNTTQRSACASNSTPLPGESAGKMPSMTPSESFGALVFEDLSNHEINTKKPRTSHSPNGKQGKPERRSVNAGIVMLTPTNAREWLPGFREAHGTISAYVNKLVDLDMAARQEKGDHANLGHDAVPPADPAPADPAPAAHGGATPPSDSNQVKALKHQIANLQSELEAFSKHQADLSDLHKAYCVSDQKARTKRKMITGDPDQQVSAASRSRRTEYFEKLIGAFCARPDIKEDYQDVVLSCAARQCVSQAAVLSFVQHARGGKILTKLKKLVSRLRVKVTERKFQECAALLEELCITDDSYHKLRTKMELQDSLPTLYKIRKNRCALNDELTMDLNLRDMVGGTSHTSAPWLNLAEPESDTPIRLIAIVRVNCHDCHI